MPFSGLIGTGAAVEQVPLEVPAVGVVRVWEVVEGSDVAVLLPLSVFCEVTIVPGQAGKEDWSGLYRENSRVKESQRL